MNADELQNDPLLGDSVVNSLKEWKRPLSDDRGMEQTLNTHHRKAVFKCSFIVVCILATLVAISIAVIYGSFDIDFVDVYRIIWNNICGNGDDSLKNRIVMDLRLPRILGGVIAGAALAICGVVLQSVLKNPLADPYTTGVSSGASLGAVLAMTTGMTVVSAEWNMVVMAFLFSLLPIGLMVAVSKLKNSSPTTIIMVGLAVMFIFNAITTVLMLLTDPNNLARVYRWQVGTLDLVTKSDLFPMAAVTAAGIIITMLMSKRLNVLSTGDENAKGLGLDVENTRLIFLVVVGLVTATVVSFTGLIGFVGLVIPHIVRLFIGADNRYLIPASAALGSAVLVAADVVGRWVLAPTILQVGVIMSFVGGPVFLWLIIRRNSSLWR